jgi:hypothetical protein
MRRQAEFVVGLSQLAKELRTSKDARLKKIDKLRAGIRDSKTHLGTFTSIPLPIDASVSIVGIDDEKSTIFKSNLFPLRLQLRTAEGGEFPVIFKNGDDLRQDQLVIQLFTLMDRLLRKENLDLKLMPYKVLATTAVDGMMQFVPSKTLGAIASEYSAGLLGYLRESHAAAAPGDVYGVDKDVHDTFVRSCGASASLCLERAGEHPPHSRVLRADLLAWRWRPTPRQPFALARWALLPWSAPPAIWEVSADELDAQSTLATSSVEIRSPFRQRSSLARRWSTPWAASSRRTTPASSRSASPPSSRCASRPTLSST